MIFGATAWQTVPKMPSLWSLDWEKALSSAKCFGFLKDDARNALGKAFNEYNWWEKVKAGR